MIRVCVFGNKITTKNLIAYLVDNGIEVSHLVCLEGGQMEKASVSGKFAGMSQWAKDKGVLVYSPSSYSLRSQADKEFFSKERFDLGLCTGWQRIIPIEILESFRIGVFGWHGSGFRFPNGRGRSPLNWTIRLGLNRVYHNCFRYSGGADCGDVFDTEEIQIEPHEYIGDLQVKALAHMKRSSIRLLKAAHRGSVPLVSQPAHPAIELPALNEASGEIFPHAMSVEAIRDLVRSCSRPFPGAFINTRTGKIRIWRASVLQSGKEALPVGEVITEGPSLYIAAVDGVLHSCDFEVV